MHNAALLCAKFVWMPSVRYSMRVSLHEPDHLSKCMQRVWFVQADEHAASDWWQTGKHVHTAGQHQAFLLRGPAQPQLVAGRVESNRDSSEVLQQRWVTAVMGYSKCLLVTACLQGEQTCPTEIAAMSLEQWHVDDSFHSENMTLLSNHNSRHGL